jgi:hypothetical protein
MYMDFTLSTFGAEVGAGIATVETGPELLRDRRAPAYLILERQHIAFLRLTSPLKPILMTRSF